MTFAVAHFWGPRSLILNPTDPSLPDTNVLTRSASPLDRPYRDFLEIRCA